MADLRVSGLGGIPFGNTAARPVSPVIGKVYYNGELGLLEIYDGTNWVPSSAPAGIPSITATDVGTSRAYASGAINLVFTAGTNGGAPYGFTGNAVLGANTYTTGSQTSTTATLNAGNPGTYSISATSYNGFGSSPNSVPISVAVTTVPEAPTIGTASISNTTTDVAITWTLGNNGGKNLSSITITPYLNGTTAGTAQTAATTSSTTHTFTGLTSGSAYTFKVKATNANGVGLESLATNSITVPTFFSADFLVIAGGGSGASPGGGGGAGGFRTATVNILKGTNYACSVGAGAAGVSGYLGNKGTASYFSTYNTTGGGAGGGGTGNGTGGSGGGGGRDGNSNGGGGNQGGYSPVEGYAGGTTSPMPYGGGAGGGGAGGVGSAGNGGTASSEIGGAGGIGASSSITGTATYYAGGGGGGAEQNSSQGGGAGGAGGGGAGGKASNNGVSGTANTGSGGGGTGTGVGSGNGGAGVIILRYLTTAATITIGAGLTGSTATDGSYKVTTITSGAGNVSWT